MRRLRIVALASACFLAAPAAALAQEHGEHVEETAGHGEHGELTFGEAVRNSEFVGALANFLLLVAIIIAFARRPLGNFLVARRKTIEEGLTEARRLKEAAEKKYNEYNERLQRLDRELEKIRKEMVAAGEAERDRIVSEAEAKAARMRRDAEFLIEQQMKQLRVDLTREAVEAAVAAAEQVLREATSPSDQQRLAQQYIERLAAEAKQTDQEAKA